MLKITKTGLKKTDGTEIITQPILRFFEQGRLKGFGRKFFLQYWTSAELEEEGFAPIEIIYNEEKLTLPNSFDKELTPQIITQYEQIVNQLLPNELASTKIIFVYHLWVKEELEKYLGKDTVEIDLTNIG
jgi:hypothetical protein